MEQRKTRAEFDAEIFRHIIEAIPAERQKEISVRHKAVLSWGLEVCIDLTCCSPHSELPFGSDRELLMWLVRRALRTRELDVYWQTLLEYLGSDPTAAEKRDLFDAARRIGSVIASYEAPGYGDNNQNFVTTLRSSAPIIEDAKHFSREMQFEMSSYFLELALEASGHKKTPGTPVVWSRDSSA